MTERIKRRIVCAAIVFCATIQLIGNCMNVAYTDSSSTLGTPEALGSPLLNGKFVSESWDKWEMIVFGIYLSNFCVPLVDSYESALTTNSGYGSDGRGLSALKIGSGNDITNNKVLEELTSQAISFQSQAASSQIYVSYTKIDDGTLADKTDPNDGGNVRAARFSDLFLLAKAPGGSEEKSWAADVKEKNTANVVLASALVPAIGATMAATSVDSNGSTSAFGGNYKINTIAGGNIPTFYVKNGEKYIEIFDYTNAWDMQIMAGMVNIAIESGYKDEFYDSYAELYGADSEGNDAEQIAFDAFGNIVCKRNGKNMVVIPSAVNQHLTESKQINLLNSWIINGYTNNISEDIVKSGKQALTTGEHARNIGNIASLLAFFSNCNYSGGGTSAFSSKDTRFTQKGGQQAQGATVLFKDSDTLYAEKGDSTNVLLDLMQHGSIKDTSLPLKMEVVSIEALTCDGDKVGNGALVNTVNAGSTLCNQTDIKQSFGMTSLLTPSGKEIDWFTDDVLVANQSKVSRDDKDSATITRQILNFLYKVYKEGSVDTGNGKIDKATVEQMLGNLGTLDDMKDVLTNAWPYYREYNSTMSGASYDPNDFSAIFDFIGNRFTVVQLPSKELTECAKLFNMENGDFSLYAAYIYVTYLRFYGINSSSILGENGGSTTKLNKELFNMSAAKDFSIDGVGGVVSQEQKKEEVLNLSYLMLSNTEEGKKYRNEISKSNLTSFINNQYLAIVNGTNEEGATNAGKAGFLTIQSLEENPFTSYIISKYADIVIYLLTIILVVIIVAGLLMNKKFSWYFITIIIYVNMILILPSFGNISSTISNKVNSQLFKSKMTFWSVEQQVEDSEVVKKVKEADCDVGILSELVDGLAMVSSDRTLMLKKDISSKLTQKLDSNYKDSLQLSTARWIIPMVMQQLSSSDEEKVNNHVYVGMINTMDDASNVYMYYNEDYKQSIGMISSDTDANNPPSSIKANDRKIKFYKDYSSTGNSTSYNGVNYRHIGYYESVYDDMSHTYFYLLKAQGHDNKALCISSNGLVDPTDIDSYRAYIDKASTSNIQEWKSTAEHIQKVSDEYNRQDLSTIDQSYGYLLNSESVYNYMYQTVEDSFSSTETLGSLVGKIQGKYMADSDGNSVRDNFMFATSTDKLYTGKTRDILDLQEFFTNNLPYMYKMWLSAGGFDGNTGVLGEEKIVDHTYYDDMNQSWFFRCNWAIKMIENNDLNGSTTVRDKDGNKYQVQNMIDPSCYPNERPMVFSRAQQLAYELDDSDLSYVELKCVKVNEDTSLLWTSLLNYAGTSHITKEILLRQMAIDATTTFNREFSTRTVMSSKYSLEPLSLDLMSLSFDSIVKMIILNITKDSSYVYGNTAETLISRVDIITSAILLITALLCTYVIPFVRNIMALVILALSMIAAVRSLTNENKFKAKILIGTAMTQIEIILVNVAYYGIFSAFIAITKDDDVISVESMKASVSSGNPVWALLALLALSVIYIGIMIKMIYNFIQNKDDMGFDRYFAIMGSLGGKISSKMEQAVNSLDGRIGGTNSTSINKTYNTNNSYNSGTKSDSNDKTKVTVEQDGDETINVTNEEKDVSEVGNKDDEISYYDDDNDNDVTNEKDRIDSEIDKTDNSNTEV